MSFPGKLILGGVDVTNDIEDDSIEIIIKKDEESKVVGEFISQGVTIGGDSYQAIRDQFFTPCPDYEKILTATLITDICGGREIELFATGENVQDDPCNCKIKVPLKSISDEQCCAQELDATEWYSDGFCRQYEFPLYWYSEQPGLLQALAILFFGVLRFILGILNAAASVIDFFLPGDQNPFDELLFQIDQWLTGAGRIIPAPYLRDVFEYQAEKCGLEFQSSIWQDPGSPYYSEALLCFETGDYLREDECDSQDKICEVFLNNAINISTIKLLQNYAIKYNADCRIIGNKLIFEPKEYFKKYATNTSINVVASCEDNPEADNPIYRFNSEDAFAALKLAYSKEPMDAQGNKVLQIGKYKFNFSFGLKEDPGVCKYNPSVYGTDNKEIPFSTAKFMFDCYADRSRIDRFIDGFRASGDSNPILDSLGFTNNGPVRECDLVVSSSSQIKCKTVLLDDSTPLKDRKVLKRKVKKGDTITCLDRESNQTKIIEKKVERNCYEYQYHQTVWELFDRFHKYDDPRIKKDSILMESYTMLCDCEAIDAVLTDKIDVGINTHYGPGLAEEIVLSLSCTETKLTVRRVAVFCEG